MGHKGRLVLAVALCALAACGDESSTDTRHDPLPNAASFIPEAPASRPKPTPTPSTDPEETWPTNPGPTGTCGEPVPPAVSRISVGRLGGSGDRVVLDATPLVGPNAEYCRQIGYTDGRLYCPVRPENSPDRFACEAERVGHASDTGRIGPTWTVDGRRCDGKGEPGSCVNHPSNQFQVHASGTGRFRACAANGACGEIKL